MKRLKLTPTAEYLRWELESTRADADKQQALASFLQKQLLVMRNQLSTLVNTIANQNRRISELEDRLAEVNRDKK